MTANDPGIYECLVLGLLWTIKNHMSYILVLLLGLTVEEGLGPTFPSAAAAIVSPTLNATSATVAARATAATFLGST